MLNEQKGPKTSHTLNKVPFVMANAPEGFSLKKADGVLGDWLVSACQGLSA
jgi:2,3-bisphosphoglycerate-independent phosphoglycerate mutase